MSRPRAYHDTDILTRAMLVFWQHGYHGANIRHLEDATGLKVSSLYHRFGSKEALFHETLDHYLNKVVRWRVKRYLYDSPEPIAGIRAFLHSSYAYIDTDAGRPPMACLMTNSALESAPGDDAIALRVNQSLALVEQGFYDAISRSNTNNSPSLLAKQLALGLQGLLITSKINTDHSALNVACNALMAPLEGERNESVTHP